jgi:hypothetical protein
MADDRCDLLCLELALRRDGKVVFYPRTPTGRLLRDAHLPAVEALT